MHLSFSAELCEGNHVYVTFGIIHCKLVPANQRCTMASASLGLSYGTCDHDSVLSMLNVSFNTDHMTSAVYSSKCKPFRAPGLASDLSINRPSFKRLLTKRLFAAPFHVECPGLVTDPVANPVIRAYIYQCSYATLKKGSDVIVGCMITILSRSESLTNSVTAGAEVTYNGSIHAQLFAHRWAIQEAWYSSMVNVQLSRSLESNWLTSWLGNTTFPR